MTEVFSGVYIAVSKGYRDGAFAVGLVTGAGLALNLFLWLDYKAQSPSDQPPQAYEQRDYSEIGQFWDWLIGTFVRPSDTLAQWIMAVFTVVAVVIIWRTLAATREMVRDTKQMAVDTREIGEAQVRPYLYVDTIEATFNKDVITGRIQIANSGSSPALNLEAVTMWGSGTDGFDQTWLKFEKPAKPAALHPQAKTWSPFNTSKEANPFSFLNPDHIRRIVSGEADFWLFGQVEYYDVFGKKWRFTYRCKFTRDGYWDGFSTCDEGNRLDQVKAVQER